MKKSGNADYIIVNGLGGLPDDELQLPGKT